MYNYDELKLVNIAVKKWLHNQEGEAMGCFADITFRTYIDFESNWFISLGNIIEKIAIEDDPMSINEIISENSLN